MTAVSDAGASGASAEGQGAGQNGGHWAAALPAEVQGYIQNKGWSDPGAIVESYRGLERLQRTPRERLLTLPEKDDAPEWGDVWRRLGKPETKDGYELPEIEVADGQVDLRGDFKDWADRHNLTATQAKGMADLFVAKMGELTTAQEEARSASQAAEEAELRREWGSTYDENVTHARNVAKRVAPALGKSAEDLTALFTKVESVVGTRDFLKLFAFLGRGTKEAGFVGGDADGGFGLTPAAAQSKLDAMKTDGAFWAKYNAGDQAAITEFRRLAEIAGQGRSTGGPPGGGPSSF